VPTPIIISDKKANLSGSGQMLAQVVTGPAGLYLKRNEQRRP
jgi:hypothetical protein